MEVRLSLEEKYFIMNVFKHTIFLESTNICITISYVIPITSLICCNGSEILKSPVPVHVVVTFYMPTCIEIIKSSRFLSQAGYKNEYMIN